MNKQIEEMRSDLIEIFDEEYEKRRLITPQNTAEKLTAKGYSKQKEGEWIDVEDTLLYRYKCSLCGEIKLGKMTNFCPNCGAKMKGDEGK